MYKMEVCLPFTHEAMRLICLLMEEIPGGINQLGC